MLLSVHLVTRPVGLYLSYEWLRHPIDLLALSRGLLRVVDDVHLLGGVFLDVHHLGTAEVIGHLLVLPDLRALLVLLDQHCLLDVLFDCCVGLELLVAQSQITRAQLTWILATAQLVAILPQPLARNSLSMRRSLVRISPNHGQVGMFCTVLLSILCLRQEAHRLWHVVSVTLDWLSLHHSIFFSSLDYRCIGFDLPQVRLPWSHHFPRIGR